MQRGYNLRGPECRVELEAYAATLIVPLKSIPPSHEELVVHGTGSERDFDDLKAALAKRLGYSQSELDAIETYEDSLTHLLKRLDSRLRSGLSNLPSVSSLHSLSLAVDRQRFVMHAVFDGDVESYFDDTLTRFGPLIDLVWRHCLRYPGAKPDGSYDEDARERFKGWLHSHFVDPAVDSSFLYVRRSNFQGRAQYQGSPPYERHDSRSA